MQTLKWLLPFALCLPLAAHAGPKPGKAVKHPQASTQVVANAAYPTNGMSMKQVRKHYGKPGAIRVSKGPVKRKWPKITEWNYGAFSVYFERTRVLHTVKH